MMIRFGTSHRRCQEDNMNRKTVLIMVPVLIVAILIVALVMDGGEKPADVRYDYDVEVVDSFMTGSGYEQESSPGEDYAIVTWVVVNDHYEDGFDTNILTFSTSVVVNGLSYTTTVDTYSHPDYKLVTVLEGGSATFAYVYDVPEGTDPSDVEVQYEYIWTFDPPTMERDPTL